MADPAEEVAAEPPAETPAEPPPKRDPIRIGEMAEAVMLAAIRNETSIEAARIAFGTQPSERDLRRIQVLTACARFLDVLAPHMPAIKKLLRERNALR